MSLFTSLLLCISYIAFVYFGCFYLNRNTVMYFSQSIGYRTRTLVRHPKRDVYQERKIGLNHILYYAVSKKVQLRSDKEIKEKNIPINRTETQQPHAVVQDLPGRFVQRHTRLGHLGLTADDLEHVVAGAEDVRHAEQVRQHRRRLECLVCVEHDVRPLRQQAGQVRRVSLGEEVQVRGLNLLAGQARLAGHGAETGVRVLQVGTGVTLERGHGVEVEVVAVDTVDD